MSTQPMNVEQVVREAQKFEYNNHLSLKNWLRTAALLRQQAKVYAREGNYQQAYFLLFRQATLVLANLPTHADAKSKEGRAELRKADEEVQLSLKKLEELKPMVNERFMQYQHALASREASAKNRGTHAAEDEEHKRSPTRRSFDMPATAHNDASVRLAAEEMRRRHQRTRIAEPVSHNDSPNHGVGRNSLSRQMQNVRLDMDMQAPLLAKSRQHLIDQRTLRSTYDYPDVPARGAGSMTTASRPPPSRVLPYAPSPPSEDGPRLLPKESAFGQLTPAYSAAQDIPPNRPPKELPAKPASVFLPTSGPDTPSFTPSAFLENGTPLRTIFLSPQLRQQFLAIASFNTQCNLETCGILCGTLKSNALFIEKLVIPEQESTSDTCEMTNDSAFFDYVDSEDLLTLGWIHTHPTQTCFMSSRDLHTHCGYQAMMAESIAIVCAPSRSDWGIFRLTDPPGMKTIQTCRLPGLFHPHNGEQIYTDALRPGHVVELEGLHYDVFDMRPIR